jgi:long-chain acyl-CoA synthetase
VSEIHPWLKSYPPGVAASIDPSALRTLNELIQGACKRAPGAVAFIQMGRALTYAQLRELSDAFSGWLRACGVRKGDRVAVMLPNVLQYPVVVAGTLRSGAVLVSIGVLASAKEAHAQLRDSGAVILVALDSISQFAPPVLENTAVRHLCLTSVGEFLPWPKRAIVNYLARRRGGRAKSARYPVVRLTRVLREGRSQPCAPVPVKSEDIAVLQYTGGTTGVPKAAVLTHGNIASNVLQSVAWMGELARQPAVLITALPLSHIYALEGNCLLFLWLGWTNVLITNPRDTEGLIRDLKRHPAAFVSGVNTLFKRLVAAPNFATIRWEALRITLGGGMAIEPQVAEAWKRATGCVLTQAWGLTECAPGVCINPCGMDFNGSVGLPLPGTEVSVKDEHGTNVPLGEHGELCVRGPQVMPGYWNAPAETAAVTWPGGWLRTGDIGWMSDAGFVYLVDRSKELINVSGRKVYPSEVEQAALSCPAIAEAAAVAQTDEKSGECVVLHVVVHQGAEADEEGVIRHCRAHLAPHQVPRAVVFRRELPKSPVGKILRRALRA